MPHLKEKKYPQAELIADIHAGTSFVKVKPENIGELIYFDSTLPKEAPDPSAVSRKRKRTLLYSLAALVVLWGVSLLVTPDALFWPFILTFVIITVALVILFGTIFSGTDLFVGTEGFAEYSFQKNRDNVEKKECRFDEGSVLLFTSATRYKNEKRTGTDYCMRFMGKPDRGDIVNTIYRLDIGSKGFIRKDGQSGDAYPDFMYQVEKQFTTLFLDKARAALEAGEEVSFYPLRYDGDWMLETPIRLSKEAIHYAGKVYVGEALKRVSIQSPPEIWFQSEDESAGLLKRMKHLVKVPLEIIGNRKAFETLLLELYGIK